MRWLQEALQDGTTKRYSSKRLNVTAAVATLCICALVLAAAAYQGKDTSEAMWAVCVALAGLAGGAYVGGKVAEGRRQVMPDPMQPYTPPVGPFNQGE